MFSAAMESCGLALGTISAYTRAPVEAQPLRTLEEPADVRDQ
jgi:hypothetical protein